jgi:taurine--2-oxoglutarate transaminase
LGLVVTGDEIVALSKKHTITEYAAQDAVNPIPVARAKGVYFWTPEGKRFIDFNSQLMSVNIGHGDPRVIAAITAQAEKVTYVTPPDPRREPSGRKSRANPVIRIGPT